MPPAPMPDEVLLEQAAYLLEAEGHRDAAVFMASVASLRRTHHDWETGGHDDIVLYLPPEQYRAWKDPDSPRLRGPDDHSLPSVVEDAVRAVSQEYDNSERRIRSVSVLPVAKPSTGDWRNAVNRTARAASVAPTSAAGPSQPMNPQTRALVADLIAAAEAGPQRFAAVFARAARLPEGEREKLRQVLEILFGRAQ